MTERLHFHFSLSCIGEGNGNPLQCSCLENPRDGGAWWAAVSGVTQSRTRLKRLSSSSSSPFSGSQLIVHYPKIWIHKEFAVMYVKSCPVYIFSQEFHSIRPYTQIYYLEFIFEYGVREYSNLILIFMAEETFRVSFIVAVTNLHPKHQWRRVPFVPTPPPALVDCRVFDEGRSFRCDVIPRCSLVLPLSFIQRCFHFFK